VLYEKLVSLKITDSCTTKLNLATAVEKAIISDFGENTGGVITIFGENTEDVIANLK
jgi:hypothetical protein